MKKDKLFIAIFFALIVIVVISIILINSLNKGKENINIPQDVKMDENIYNATSQIQKEKNVATYITVSNCIDTYFNYVKKNEAEGITSILTQAYKKDENITNNNVLDKVTNINENCKYYVEEVYLYDKDFFFKTYIVMGKIIDTFNSSAIKENFLVNIDTKKRTFEISNLKDKGLENIDKNELEKIEKEISLNSYNEANIAVGISEKEVVQYYFERNIFNMLYNTENAFNMLDKDYKEKRFGTYENFVNYINENKEKIEKSYIQKYKIEKFKNYTEYLCMDNFNNTYIFLEKEPMQYTVILDDYTVTDGINNKIYREKDRNGKAQINAEKFSHMLNVKDYDKAYAVLDNKFKEKYFPNLEDFKKYIIDIFYNSNKFEFIEISKEEGKYKIKTKIINNENEEESFIKRIKVELLENGEYAISFDI